MSLLQLTVFPDAKEVALGIPVLEEVVSYTSSSVSSTVLPLKGNGKSTIYRVRLMSDTDCWVQWGTSPTALVDGSSGRMLAAEAAEYFAIPSGDSIAVIAR